jgi:hypothetical protein
MDLDKPTNSGDSGTKRSLKMTLEAANTEKGFSDMNMLAGQAIDKDGKAQEVIEENDIIDTDQHKRQRKDGAVSPSLGSAGSHEEPVRSQ